ncbi:MAG: heavy metal translocating P-type ATPase, partial [bacterium]|nr:heavy metal translocating P-type ATPase [bacterium]
IKGSSNVNESMITGESKPIAKKVADAVIAGTINGNGSLTVKVTHVGTDTALAGIMRLVAEAQRSKSRTQILADKAALYLTIIAIVVGIITLNGWLLAGAGLAFALERLVSVLVITCPHALGLAVPLVTSISTSLSAKHGLLIRNRLALESARNIDVVLFDKTGTLTVGEQGVADVVATGKLDVATITKLAATLENDSEHSIGQAIVAFGKQKKTATGTVSVADWQSLPGKGVQGVINKNNYHLGGPQLLLHLKITPDSKIVARTKQFAGQGKTVLYLIEKSTIIGLLTITDIIRPESQEAVEALHRLGIQVAMVTGDSNDVAQYVATELKIDTVFAEVLPENKVSKVKELQSQGQKVAMVGDGVNDAPALTQSDVGIAIGAGTDVAIESAGIILVKSDPRAVVSVFTLARATYRKMIQNLIWATGYNVLAIPLAAGVFVNQGITLQPAVAAILMSFSTIIVAANAQLLRKIKL